MKTYTFGFVVVGILFSLLDLVQLYQFGVWVVILGFFIGAQSAMVVDVLKGQK